MKKEIDRPPGKEVWYSLDHTGPNSQINILALKTVRSEAVMKKDMWGAYLDSLHFMLAVL